MNLSEVELFQRLINHVREAGTCAKGIAQLRKDSRWQGISNALAVMTEGVMKLAGAKGLSHDQSMSLLDQQEQKIAVEAAKQRFREQTLGKYRDYGAMHD